MTSKTLIGAAAAILMGAAMPARALDGCKVVLCLAGPWEGIPTCVSEIEQLFQDLRNGDPFPSCGFASGATYAPNISNAPALGAASAENAWLAQSAPAPDPNCPPQYVTRFDSGGRAKYGCRYAGMIPLRIDGQLWSKTYWTTGGGTVTELSAYAQSVWGVQGVKWIGDLQAYQAAHAAAAAAAAAQAGSGGGD